MFARTRITRFGTLIVAILTAPLALGQPVPASGTLHRMNPGATYQHGCFPPCACPISGEVPVLGTMRVRHVSSDPLFEHYQITDVNWIVPQFDTRITGSGTYRVGGEVAVQQQLTMDLKVGSDPVQHFDSGLVSGGGGFPRIDITISIHGMFCLDTVIHVNSSPANTSDLRQYRVTRDSTYQEGCFDPCDCILREPQPMIGSFQLLPIGNDGANQYYAVLSASFSVLNTTPPPPGMPGLIRGQGIYLLNLATANANQRLRMDLVVASNPSTAFDSGLVVGGDTFPVINIQISMNHLFCYDKVLTIHARPTLYSLSPIGP